MRSSAIAWLMDLYGFKVYTLAGGYKKFRNYVLDTFKLPWRFKLLGGYTGSGKTETLKALEQKAEKVIDLEKIAGHKGSAFGNIGLPPQPAQEMFENLLSCELRAVSYEMRDAGCETPDADANGRHSDPEGRRNSRLPTNELLSTINYRLTTTPIWLEDESQRIGQVNIPNDLWKIMRQSPVYFLDIPFEVRLQHLTEEYGGLDPERMLDAISRIREKLGGLNARLASQLLIEGNIHESSRILLEYYDRAYLRSLHNREGLNSLLHTIESKSITVENANLLTRHPEQESEICRLEKI